MNVDFIIVGQGICGTFLSYYLRQAGKKILVIDEARPFCASKVASGVINPVTGRRVVTVWMAEELLDFSWKAYTTLGNELGETLITQNNIVSFPPSQQMVDVYNERQAENNSYIQKAQPGNYQQWFAYLFEPVEIAPTYLVNLHPLLHGWRKKLKEIDCLLEEGFDESLLRMQPGKVSYKGIDAQCIIYCNGADAWRSTYWKNLPSVYNKGEALIVDIPGLPQQHIYKFGANSFVPWYDGLWWVGSSYDNNFADELPTERFKQQKERELGFALRQPFTIVDHIAGVRPATIERRPFVGLHPLHDQVGILNGMGTKGCSLAPYFALQLSQHLTSGATIMAEADVKRFQKILSNKSAIKN
ncbi:NAD(P)/FAD-dependent oxidoreductase [Foetidibacter luteolus]|uniref:NAD(P)/FAD-dependent oxidoreductase n=1 Tax=Foetidibacter luteolus TaxID=2608880 RepID=UPI00129BC0DE|nr:FAD-binding oxidoreductase [Foetidibacter luteolus]